MQRTLESALSARLHARQDAWTSVLWVTFASLFLAVLAQIAVPLPFTPVPMTLQTLGVLLVGAALGSKRGTAAVALYLAQGAVGLPVFASGGFGLAKLAGPTGGYLIGFLFAAYLVGAMAERGFDRKFRSSWLAFALGHLTIYGCGTLWLAVMVGWSNAFAMGVVPFVAGDAIKVAVASLALPAVWQFVGRK